MIEIPFGPNMFRLGPVLLTWHGFFTFVAVLAAVFLVARWARREEKVGADRVYDTAIWAVLGGIVGARLVHVIDRWDLYQDNPLQIFAVYEGGIAIWGAVLGGFAGGVIYTRIAKYPTAKLADLAAPALLIAMAIGRIGDIINGEHCALITRVWWGFTYTHADSPAGFCYGRTPTPAMHPAVVYEIIWDLAIFAVLFWGLRSRLRPDGMLFAAFLMFYSVGRFFITFLRDDKVWFAGLQEAQVISLIVLAITVPLLAYRAQLSRPAAPVEEAPPSAGLARRRRRRRG